MGIPNCQLVLTVPRPKSEIQRLLALSSLDQYYYDTRHKAQKLGFRFSGSLDPSLAAQSLTMAIDDYPVVGSKVVSHEGKDMFHFDAERVKLRLLHVQPLMMESMDHLEQLCEIFCVPDADQKQNQLFGAFLFKTSDPADGSVLICSFQHCIGDATSYALFMRRWSYWYERLCASTKQEPDLEMPPEVFTDYGVMNSRRFRSADGNIHRSFSFADEDLAALKRQVEAHSTHPAALTSNDILCAQCALAIAPFRFEASGARAEDQTRIFVLADSRTRSAGGHSSEQWGNYVTDITVDLAWSELLDRSDESVGRVALRIRETLAAQSAMLAADKAGFDSGRAGRRKVEKLLCWNSWARVGHCLREVTFGPPAPADAASGARAAEGAGGRLEEVRWFNAAWCSDADTVLVEPAAAAGGGGARVVVHVASPKESAAGEAEGLQRFWGGARMHED